MSSMALKTENCYVHELMGMFLCVSAQNQNDRKSQRLLGDQKLTLDGWLSAIKYGRWGDIMTVYVLSLMKGLQTCIHLRNGKVWSTLHATPILHNELIERCEMHLAYLGFGILL